MNAQQQIDRRISNARIVVTQKYGEQLGARSELVPVNRVVVIDGLNNELGSIVVRCKEHYDPKLPNRIGVPGAFYSVPDDAAIERVIAQLRGEHPEFRDAPVRNNSKR